MTNKRILFLSVSAGSGHVRAAEALRSCVIGTHPNVNAIHHDVMQFVPWYMRWIYVDLYIFLIKTAPGLWGHIYRLTNNIQTDNLLSRLQRWLKQQSCKRFINAILAFDPHVIVCTHFLPAEILSHLIVTDRLTCPVWVQVTDFDLHRIWIQKHMAGYFVANEEVALLMQQEGMAMNTVHVTGIPIMPAFAIPLERASCAQSWHIDPQITTLLLMGGGTGIGQLSVVAKHLLELQTDLQIVVLAGNNQSLLSELQALAKEYNGRLKPIGFTPQVERLMACADLIITKSGGLTVSECLAMGLPMIVMSSVPGQEERNANYVLEHGAALKALDFEALKYRVHHLLTHPEKLADMRAQAKILGRPTAAHAVIDIIMKET